MSPKARSTASAKSPIEANSRSYEHSSLGSGVAPQPARSWRRLIQTDVRPWPTAGTWSWNRLCATCSSRSARSQARPACGRAREVVVGGFVRPDVLGGDDRGEIALQALVAAGETGAVHVGHDDQPVVLGRGGERVALSPGTPASPAPNHRAAPPTSSLTAAPRRVPVRRKASAKIVGTAPTGARARPPTRGRRTPAGVLVVDLEFALGCPRPRARRDPCLPIDQRAVAVEAQRLVLGQVGG